MFTVNEITKNFEEEAVIIARAHKYLLSLGELLNYRI